MEIDSRDRRLLHEALSKAFDRSDLEQILDFELNVRLGNIAREGDFHQIAFDVISHFHKVDRLKEFILVVYRERPSNKKLAQLVSCHSLLEKPKHTPNRVHQERFDVSAFPEQKSSEISNVPTLLLGVLVDVSRSMVNLLSELPDQSEVSKQDLSKSVEIIAEKVIGFGRTEESDMILSQMAMFVYGFGFEPVRKTFLDIVKIMGAKISDKDFSHVPSTPIRDVFAEMATKYELPETPTTAELHKYWATYRKSIESLVIDAGGGNSILYEALSTVQDRYGRELEQPYSERPILFLIADGQMSDGTNDQLLVLAQNIQQMGIQIVSCYIGRENITQPHKFYTDKNPHWPDEAKRLFDCSSAFTDETERLREIRERAKEAKWDAPKNAKLFIQINNIEMFQQLVDFILRPIKSER